MNIGPQPTIDPLLPSAVEVHLIHKDVSLYGLDLTIEPVQRIRSQIKFENIDQLTYQIKVDRENALQILKNLKNNLKYEKFNLSKPDDLRIAQIIDANLDRAREGLRVLEDWARFALGKEDFVIQIKNFRQILGKNHLEIYKLSRNYTNDQCKGLTHEEQFKRNNPKEIISSNSARVQEALRVIEEFTRNQNNYLSKIASNIRYEIYTELNLLNHCNLKAKTLINKHNLYSITDKRENLIQIIEQILLGGVKIIQYRFKDGSDKIHLKEAIKIKSICKKYESLLIINDRIDIALASNVDGVHLGQDDIDILTARKLLGPSKIIGITANNSKDINNAIKNGCDYVGVDQFLIQILKKVKNLLE